jgi:uncharacterized membrane protein
VAEEVSIKVKTRWRDRLQRYFLAGLLVFLPVAITLWFIGWVIDLLDSVLAVLPVSFHPNSYLSFPIPKLGAVVTLLLILFLGVLTRGVATRKFLAAWESVFIQIPIFRGIYSAVQKLVQTFLGPSNAQRQVVMVEYPRIGVFTIGFAMGRAWSHLEDKKNAQLVNVFIPTTPNPTSGFYLLFPTDQVTPLNLTMEEALKLITSSGLITPDDKNKNGN